MTSLREELGAIVGRAFADAGLPRELGTVQVSDRPDLAQFQSNGALAAAKLAKANPREVAEKVAGLLRANPIFAEISIAGPGFINLKLTEQKLSATLPSLDAALGGSSGGDTVVIDFGGPNIAKPMHVGHLRSTVIGDSLQRLFRFAGWKVVSDVHLGDWGKQMGMLIVETMIHTNDPALDKVIPPDLPEHRKANSTVTFTTVGGLNLDTLEKMYPQVSAATQQKPELDEYARKATTLLQSGDADYVGVWKELVAASIVGLKREFASLGVTFDLWNGEANAEPFVPDMVADLKSRGIAVEDQGAWVVPIAEEGDKHEMPPLILISRDGSALYGTTDIATIIDRVKSHDPAQILYVVDQRQHQHFVQVFRAAAKAGYPGRAKLEHVGFGTMNGPDRKPFKTRAGGVLKLFDLIEMATAEALKRIDEQGLAHGYGNNEKHEIARKVGIAALKFADLQNYRLTDYVFDLERFTRFEGKTGPYLQYAAVRIKSLLRRAADEGHTPGAPAIHAPAERDLALALLRFPDAVADAVEKRAPNILCEFVFNAAQAYSRFYTEHHILSETDAGLRASRLGLSQLTLRTLETSLGLLGIEVPDRM